MLNDYQIMVVRRAVAAAKDKEAEIKRIAKGMQVKESEIRLVLDQAPQESSSAAPAKKPEKKSSRHTWTTGQVEQLLLLRAEGKGPTEIAKIMGLTAAQVNSRLKLEKKQAAEPELVEDDTPTLLKSSPEPELEPTACELEPQVEQASVSESKPAILPDAVRSLGELARKIFSSDVAPEADPEPFPFPELEEKRPFLLASEIMNLIKYLEYSYPPVEMGLLQANQAAGWATCRFTAAGQQYLISLRREESET